MKRYKVWVCLEATFDGDEAIEAETEEEAFIQASDMAMAGCSWEWNAEEIKEDHEDHDWTDEAAHLQREDDAELDVDIGGNW